MLNISSQTSLVSLKNLKALFGLRKRKKIMNRTKNFTIGLIRNKLTSSNIPHRDRNDILFEAMIIKPIVYA